MTSDRRGTGATSVERRTDVDRRARIFDRELRADDRLDPGSSSSLVEPRCAVEAIAIDQCQRVIAQGRRPIDQRLRRRGSPKEREGRCGVELDKRIHFAFSSPSYPQHSGRARWQMWGENGGVPLLIGTRHTEPLCGWCWWLRCSTPTRRRNQANLARSTST